MTKINKEIPIVIRGYNDICRSVVDSLSFEEKKQTVIVDKNTAFKGRYNDVEITNTIPNSEVDRTFVVCISDFQSIHKELTDIGVMPEKIFSAKDFMFRKKGEIYNNEVENLTAHENATIIESEIFNKSEVASLPNKLTIETSTLCNLNCVMCYYYKQENKEQRIINDSCLYEPKDFQKHFGKLESICLQIGGEPLISTLFWDFIEFIGKQENQPLLIFKTNGIALNEKNIDRLLSSGIKKISMQISLDAATSQTYRRIRGADFNKVITNVKCLVQKKKTASVDLTIGINMTCMRENIEELPLLIELGKNIGVDFIEVWPIQVKDTERNWYIEKDGFNFYYLQQHLNWYPNVVKRAKELAEMRSKELDIKFTIRTDLCETDFPSDIEYPITKQEFDKQTALYTESQKNSSSLFDGNKKCPYPWTSAFIFENGDVRPCCQMHSVFGNIYLQNWDEIWNSEIAKQVRQGIIDNRLNANCKGSKCAFALAENINISPLPFNKKVLFSQNNNNSAEYIHTKGISFPEGNGAWLFQQSSNIIYKPEKAILHTVELQLSPFIYNDKALLSSVCINGENIKIDKNTNIINLTINASNIDELGNVVIKIVTPFVPTPSDLKLNTDERNLTLKLHSLKIKFKIQNLYVK